MSAFVAFVLGCLVGGVVGVFAGAVLMWRELARIEKASRD